MDDKAAEETTKETTPLAQARKQRAQKRNRNDDSGSQVTLPASAPGSRVQFTPESLVLSIRDLTCISAHVHAKKCQAHS